MGFDAIEEKKGVGVGEEIVVKKEALTGEGAIRLLVETFLEPDLTKGKAENVMADCLPAIDGWLLDSQENLSGWYNPQETEIDGKEWDGFLGRRYKAIMFSFKRVCGGRLRLCVQRRREGDGVIVWLHDPDPKGDSVEASEIFNTKCGEIFKNDDNVAVETDSRGGLDRLIFQSIDTGND